MAKTTVYLDDFDGEMIAPGTVYANVATTVFSAEGVAIKTIRSTVAERNFGSLPAGIEGKPRGRKPGNGEAEADDSKAKGK